MDCELRKIRVQFNQEIELNVDYQIFINQKL
jgi:hypothetical protein